ncbi:hypothetical protein MLD38_021646 [Melastoma candidum]|uniref:Uncharacterized protein n=1 Tax=Melastoma candidum TaxID=119954 RepID=A0ACB9QGN4_9MYRT|nr:hypothetical protein MLD38_021646 [Melastoma candidum]
MRMASSVSTNRVMMSLRSSMENEGSTHTGSTISHDDAVRDSGMNIDMYEQMWQACAGCLVYVPRAGESILYFLQGHLEHIQPYVNQDSDAEMPVYDLPAKIHCKVLGVQLKVSPIDLAFCCILFLHPLFQHDEASSNAKDMMSAGVPRTKPHIYSKVLTSSDTSMHGGFSLPKRLADECLPPLDMTQHTPSQEIVAKDLHGVVWRFHHIYRGHPRRHLLTTRWSAFVATKKLVAGDVCIFLRGDDGDLCIGIRRSVKSRINSSPSVISSHSMQHGILANAFHAINTGTMFTVYYRPWTSPSAFIVPLNQCIKSTKNEYSVCQTFKMLFEDDAGGEQKFGGTITGVEDIDHVRWPESKWRCIKVKWDSDPDEHLLPERISPWELELVIQNKQKQSFPLAPPKRICLENTYRDPIPDIANGRQMATLGAHPNPNHGVFQGQEATHNLSRSPNSAKPTGRDHSARSPGNQGTPKRQTRPKGRNNRTGPSLHVSHVNLEFHQGEAPEAGDQNDPPPSPRKEIKVFGVNLVGTP